MSPANNLAASVKAQLQNKARETRQPFNDLLLRYGMERFLYRLSQSDYADIFVLKGALLFMVWDAEYQRRTTMNIDLLGFTDNSLDHLKQIVMAVCDTKVEEDGLRFDAGTVIAQRIKEDADSTRFSLTGTAVLSPAHRHR